MTREIPCKIGDDVFAIQNFKGTKHIMKGKVSEMFFVGEEMDLCICQLRKKVQLLFLTKIK